MIPEHITEAARRARLASRAGAVCMYIVAALACVYPLILLYAAASTDALAGISAIQIVIKLVDSLVGVASFALLAEFLRHFGQDASPFGLRQSRRLLAVAVLLVMGVVINLFVIPADSVTVVEGSIPIGLSDAGAGGLHLWDLALIVFFFCLALVFRYGDALKQDSDAFA